MLSEINTMSCKKYLYNLTESQDDLQSYLVMMTVNSFKAESGSSKQAQSKITELQNNQSPITSECYTKSITDTVKLAPIQIHILRREKYLTVKYIQKWKDITKKRREYVFERQRQVTVNNFMNKLQTKKCIPFYISNNNQKAKAKVHDYQSYQHRYKVQKNIIALQKAKLEEQDKLIEELKLNKISEASKQSVENIKSDVRKSFYEVDRKLKPKIQCISKDLNLSELEDPAMVLHCLKMPQFLRRMEARARKREEKHATIRERRKQMEEERLRLKQQEELEKPEMDKEEKKRRLKSLKEKRKREKIESIRKREHAERMRALTVMADLHYERCLMSKYGIRPFKLLIEINEVNIEKAKAHFTFQMTKNMFFGWMWYTEDMCFERNYKAEEFYRRNLLKKAFECFKKIHHERALKRQVAEDYYDLYVTKLVFNKFRDAISIIKAEYESKCQKAGKYYDSNLIFKTFSCWRTLPALNALKSDQELRKSRWRQRVLLVVPDYQPPNE